MWGERHMGQIYFRELGKELENHGIQWDIPSCCDPSVDHYSMLRVQMRGEISASPQGVWIEGTEHDEKCHTLLKLAKKENYSLVMFPEYCISGNILKRLAEDQQLWPERTKLWVLPCQGIRNEDFSSLLDWCKAQPNIFLLDTAWNERNITKNKFVTAVFYCFRVYRDEQPILCLVPQLKTQPMGDREYLCETAGMTTGSIIFTLNNRLLTLLCADSMNNELTWQSIQDRTVQGPIILHPQLNPAPKDPVFSRIRNNLFEHDTPGICLTCNWAEGTVLCTQSPGQKKIHIRESWSCIYHKHTDDIEQSWKEKGNLRQENERHGLFGALMKVQRTEVWFSPYYEQALELYMPNLASRSFAKMRPPDICAKQQFIYGGQEKGWEAVDQLVMSLQERIEAVCSEEEDLLRYSKEVPDEFRFPLDSRRKYDVDQFFALALAGVSHDVLEIGPDEQLVAWTQLLNETEVDTAAKALDDLWRLINILLETGAKTLPPQCRPMKEHPEFCYRAGEKGKPGINFKASGLEVIAAFALEARNAQKHLKFLQQSECNDDEDLARQYVRVFYDDLPTRTVRCLPKLTTDITQGSAVHKEGDITNGGMEPDC